MKSGILKLLNDKVKNTVGHTSLNFSPEDGERLHYDDALMLQIAHDYMAKMGIANTQYIVARHTDKEHPHCHIVFNRVDNDGKTISDKNDFYRNEKVRKMLTAKYRLHFANGKDNIKKEHLRRFWEYSNGVGGFPDWCIILVHCNFAKK